VVNETDNDPVPDPKDGIPGDELPDEVEPVEEENPE
jgi:hypothetical protein